MRKVFSANSPRIWRGVGMWIHKAKIHITIEVVIAKYSKMYVLRWLNGFSPFYVISDSVVSLSIVVVLLSYR